MNLSIQVDASPLVEAFAVIKTQQIPFAMAKALNDTAVQFQSAEINHMRAEFTERRPTWMDMSVKIKPFATKQSLFVTISIDPPKGKDGSDRSDIIGKFEDQTSKGPFKGNAVAIPTQFIKRNKSDIVPTDLSPANLNLKDVGNRVLGWKRTFLIKTPSGKTIILQRIGKGRRSITAAIWLFRPSVRISPDLHFQQTARAVVEAGWAANFTAAFAQAMSTSR
jgi:hypothetical protein